MDIKSWIGDLDLGEMFHNFPLDVGLQPYCGIDMSPYFSEVKSWERWVRLMMGLSSSPYCSIKGFQVALEAILGDCTDPSNVFHWTDIMPYLPGDPTYNPTRPRVWKLNAVTGKMASSLLTYVDDLQGLGCTQQQCWEDLHHVASKLAYLGIQVAARNTRPPSTIPGPWAGAVAWSSSAGVSICSTREKWIRAQQIVLRWRQDLQEHHANMHSKGLFLSCLEGSRGFLVHMQHVYPAMTPYIKGLHLTVDSWRDNCNVDGWKLNRPPSTYPGGDWDKDMDPPDLLHNRPQFVKSVPRYGSDLDVLHLLLMPKEPPLRFV
jgi:hypothetical protein